MSLFDKIFNKQSKNIITFDGEYGSGANEIAKKVAEKLNYKFYDEKLIELMSLEKKVKPEDITKDDSFLQGTIYDLYRQNYSYSQEDMAANDAAFLLDSRTIREIEKEGRAVIFGKCADFVLETDEKLKVFIYASEEFKEKRILNVYNIKEEKLELKLTRENNRRSNHYSRNTGKTWGDRVNYDICLNSSEFDLDEIVNLIIEVSKIKK
ncbi:cytidylate kinase-like family protein [Peptoniphilus sp. MSJ-1]|uniref:Cytidylate kinase-like family protein n=1 Tax=Peptoniphilus ovalis TaxID=2841503 RepID=A0ABS6FII2_9FIRM|nr:cytidylate kinase-like family protein [Peptoniphilus ovalis]MBU5669814.1 cytidylate kinase-like family protein [Peptoniphilus ovalis]